MTTTSFEGDPITYLSNLSNELDPQQEKKQLLY